MTAAIPLKIQPYPQPAYYVSRASKWFLAFGFWDAGGLCFRSRALGVMGQQAKALLWEITSEGYSDQAFRLAC